MVHLWVRSATGDARAWLLSSNFATVTTNDDASSETRDAHVRKRVPRTGLYYIAFRDANREDNAFTVSLALEGPASPSGETRCGSACVNLATDVLHCGRCETACAVPAMATGATCVVGACDFVCAAGFVKNDGRCVVDDWKVGLPPNMGELAYELSGTCTRTDCTEIPDGPRPKSRLECTSASVPGSSTYYLYLAKSGQYYTAYGPRNEAGQSSFGARLDASGTWLNEQTEILKPTSMKGPAIPLSERGEVHGLSMSITSRRASYQYSSWRGWYERNVVSCRLSGAARPTS